MAGAFTTDAAVAWLHGFGEKVAAQAEYLTQLDSAIGDADHGTNLKRGMAAVEPKLEGAESLQALVKAVGMTFISKVGGASGSLYGSFFLEVAKALPDGAEAEASDVEAALRAGLGSIVARGKAEPGDKTMVDALRPALEALGASLAGGGSLADAAAAAAAAAAEGRDATEPLVARKGRASYLGERSAGHIDPGAASSALLLEALAEAVAA
ncbi:dihydroxyacetone kinase subunit DhaL [Microbacterium rhizophilus]|uniref:dihydroxyacetone kinase subunit DhaL n=1 Tax=Microbacterium rhizophilus TaxID=3138934 RepID=UPI0031EC4BA4